MPSDFIDYVTELLTPLGGVRSKRMFGGVGIYIDGLFCAIIADEALYFKADDINEADFVAAGCELITYEKQGEIFTMRYYRVPEEAMDNSHEMTRWAKLGMAAALRKAANPKSPKTKPAAAVKAKGESETTEKIARVKKQKSR